MKRLLFAGLVMLGSCFAYGQDPALTVTLPTGKIVTFATPDQKATYLASVANARAGVSSARQKEYSEINAADAAAMDAYDKKRLADKLRVRLRVYSASTRKDGYKALVKPCTLHSYSNSVIEDAMGNNRTYYYQVDEGTDSFSAFVVWDCAKNPISDETFDIDAYPCGDWINDGKRFPKYVTSIDEWIASTKPPSPEPVAPAPNAGDLAAQIRASQARAIQKYPDLAKAGSPINVNFLRIYNALKIDHDDWLNKPTWPEELADSCAKALQPKEAPTTDIRAIAR